MSENKLQNSNLASKSLKSGHDLPAIRFIVVISDDNSAHYPYNGFVKNYENCGKFNIRVQYLPYRWRSQNWTIGPPTHKSNTNEYVGIKLCTNSFFTVHSKFSQNRIVIVQAPRYRRYGLKCLWHFTENTS